MEVVEFSHQHCKAHEPGSMEANFDEFKEALKFHKVDQQIRKDSRSVKNRIQSILSDAQFVLEVHRRYRFPVLCNERAGRWYVPETIRSGSVYFKSTDGHTNQWGFSTRRLNLNVFDVVASNGGAIIVDSTRRGKRYPDALSKTVPAWCAVVNKVVFGKNDSLFTPFTAVSRSEHSQISQRIDQWCAEFAECGIDIETFRGKLDKPLRPLFVDPEAILPQMDEFENPYQDFYPLILCSASRAIQDGTEYRQGFTYVQGAADDHELWAAKLDADLLYEHQNILGNLDLSSEMLESKIDEFAAARDSKVSHPSENILHIEPTEIYISQGNSIEKATKFHYTYDLCTSKVGSSEQIMHTPLEAGKKGAKQLRGVLPQLIEKYQEKNLYGQRVLVCCDTGSDFSVAVALALICLFYSSDFMPLEKKTSSFLNKSDIRKRMVHILSLKTINPSRATLNSLNSFLMG